ncbi:MAG: hypothetical protein IJM54_10195 [Thermoguttaceae bacterium]|nr:hypothetical protein [Thermoguttaceae bacterium]
MKAEDSFSPTATPPPMRCTKAPSLRLSERCVGVVVDVEHGAVGQANLQKEFVEETL